MMQNKYLDSAKVLTCLRDFSNFDLLLGVLEGFNQVEFDDWREGKVRVRFMETRIRLMMSIIYIYLDDGFQHFLHLCSYFLLIPSTFGINSTSF